MGQAMGVTVSGDAAGSAENVGQDETEDLGNEDESIVHQTASVGDVEVMQNTVYVHILLGISCLLDEKGTEGKRKCVIVLLCIFRCNMQIT